VFRSQNLKRLLCAWSLFTSPTHLCHHLFIQWSVFNTASLSLLVLFCLDFLWHFLFCSTFTLMPLFGSTFSLHSSFHFLLFYFHFTMPICQLFLSLVLSPWISVFFAYCSKCPQYMFFFLWNDRKTIRFFFSTL